jgi:hypothetical protein
MKHRNLRIAWSVAWGLLAVLLCLLWVRSNSYLNEFWVNIPFKRGLGFISWDSSASVTIEVREPDPTLYSVGYSNHEAIHVARGREDNGRHSLLGFYVAYEPGVSYIWIPYWFLIPLSVIAAAAPWLRHRFSLRTLLIATTLIAVVLGMIVWMSRAG